MKILLVDNGSLEPKAVLALRTVARALSRKVGREVVPVPLAHSDKIAPANLGGVPAPVVESFLRVALAAGEREFVILPFFVGPSLAVTRALPILVEKLRAELPASAAAEFAVGIAPALHEAGDTTLTQILTERVRAALRDYEAALPAGAEFSETRFRARVALVDHGSPTRAVTQVRDEVAARLAESLAGEVAEVVACSMERRSGAEYDFNEPLLENVLARPEWCAQGSNAGGATAAHSTATGQTPRTNLVIVAPLFLLPGRHAGPGGDIAQICARARDASETAEGIFSRGRRPGAAPARITSAHSHTVQTKPLWVQEPSGAHPLLVELLARRLTSTLR
ncbi:sirohydrochlorin chelatase [Cephaloticoccus primus]|uniref:sirohydrochlorin chelatase n=1 Tax=Cephaloticoccus primus TaxID=1548207 RepID=UPI0012E811EC|nr:cobalamin biosynthesis protein CbiX [Cephaloticoccus primus]